MSGLLLTDAERERFAAYLEREAASNEAMARQMEQIKVPEAVIKRERLKALAARMIAENLRSTESVSIDSSDAGREEAT